MPERITTEKLYLRINHLRTPLGRVQPVTALKETETETFIQGLLLNVPDQNQDKDSLLIKCQN